MHHLHGLHAVSEADELVPRRRGRPLRPYSLADTKVPDGEPRANGKRCGDCPKNHGWTWCLVSARFVNPSKPACKYGKAIMRTSAV